MSDEDDETTTVVYTQQYSPIWRFTRWDIVAAVLHIGGGVAMAVSQGFSHVAQSASAHANWVRQNYDIEEAEAQREAVEAEVEGHMAEIVGLPTTTKDIPEAEQ